MLDMEQLLAWTAWPMKKPVAYGPFHLSFFLGGLAVVILAAYLLRRTSEKQNRVILLGVGVLLFVCELYKQLFYTFYIGHGSYQWWIFPFQLCSIPMYLCLIAPFVRHPRVRDGMYNFMISYNLMGGFMAFLEPSGLLHEYWTLTVHAFLWHMLLVFVGFYLGFSGRAGKRLSSFGEAVGVYLSMAAVAFGINLLLGPVSKYTINMFFVGPQVSPIIVFHQVAQKYGWYVNLPLYLFACTLGAFLFFVPFWWLQRSRTTARRSEKAELMHPTV